MFKVLREKAPRLPPHQDPNGPAFWNVVKHDDLVEVNRDTELYSSEIGGTSIPDPGTRDNGGARLPGGDDAHHRPAQAHPATGGW